MSGAELQAYVARLYTDSSFRMLHRVGVEETFGGYFLSRPEQEAIRGIDQHRLESFALSLKAKRGARLVEAYPALFALPGAAGALNVYCDRYCDLFPLRPRAPLSDEVIQFGRFMEETLLGADAVPRYVADLVRYIRIIHEVRRDGEGVSTAVSPAGSRVRRFAPHERVARRPGVVVERFAFNVSEIENDLRRGNEPVLQEREENLVYAYDPERRDARVLRVSGPTATLLHLCDGSRTVAQIAQATASRHDLADLDKTVLRVVRQMIARNVVEVSDGAASAAA